MKYFLAILLVLCLSMVQALTITDTASKSMQITNWNTNLVVDQFNSALGTLNYVRFILQGNMSGDAKFENVSTSSGGTLDWTLLATLTLSYSGTNLVIATPGSGGSDNLTVYDGSLNYGGTSGRTYTGLNATDTKENTLIAGIHNVAPYIGTGTVTLNLAAVGSITLSGYSNVQNLITTNAAGSLTIEYGYTVQQAQGVPEPGSLFLMGCGIFAAVAFLRRK